MWSWLQTVLSHITLEGVGKAVPIVVTAGTALAGVIVWRQKNKDRKRELTRAQAEKGKALMDEIISDKEASQALLMIEPDTRSYQVHGQEQRISHQQVLQALATDSPDDVQLYIRDCFDKLFYLLDRAKSHMIDGLVRPDDLSSPLTYYARQMEPDRTIYRHYLRRTVYLGVDPFLSWLGNWSPYDWPPLGGGP